MMFHGEDTIARALGNSIYSLTGRNEDYGTGFNLILNPDNSVTLELMDDCSKYGTVIKKIRSARSDTMVQNQFVAEIVNSLEVAVFNIE